MWICIKWNTVAIYMLIGKHLINHVFQNQHRNRIGYCDLLPIKLRPECTGGQKIMGMWCVCVIGVVLFFLRMTAFTSHKILKYQFLHMWNCIHAAFVGSAAWYKHHQVAVQILLQVTALLKRSTCYLHVKHISMGSTINSSSSSSSSIGKEDIHSR